jgi:hypothetical protein
MNRLAIAAIVGLGVLAPSVAFSQSQTEVANPSRGVRWGPQVSLAFDNSDVGLGIRLHHSLSGVLGGAPISGQAEANWFPGSPDIFDFDYDVVYNFRSSSVQPYAGGGLNLLIASPGGSDFHLNALGGVIFKPLGKITPLLQLRYIFVGGGDEFIGTFGIMF